MTVENFEFVKKLQESGGEVFLVGGINRDKFLGKRSKDIDLIVRNLEIQEITSILEKFGTFTETSVGNTFGVIKFMPNRIKLDEPIDIALPRVERMMTADEMKKSGVTNAYNAFVVNSNPFLPIEEDLKRRDFTINSIAFDLQKGEYIDPFGGITDIGNKVLRHTNDEAFADDPLRMFRAVQFISRFEGFRLEDSTFELIKNNAYKAKELMPERIIVELNKIFDKGDISRGIKYLRNTGLQEVLFGIKPFPSDESTIKTRADFFYQICGSSKKFVDILRGDIKTTEGIRAIEQVLKSFSENKIAKSRMSGDQLKSQGVLFDTTNLRLAFFDAIQTSSSILESGVIPPLFKEVQREFVEGKLPKSLGELNVNGFDLMELGMKGKEIGEGLRLALVNVLSGKPNEKAELIASVSK